MRSPLYRQRAEQAARLSFCSLSLFFFPSVGWPPLSSYATPAELLTSVGSFCFLSLASSHHPPALSMAAPDVVEDAERDERVEGGERDLAGALSDARGDDAPEQ